MAGSTPIYGFPYPESSDLVANYPALGEQLAEDIESTISGLPAAGLSIVSPTSIANSGGSASASGGAVSFTGVSSVSLNGVFTSATDNYLVIVDITSSANDVSTLLRLRASGTDNTANNYTRQLIRAYGSDLLASNVTATSAEIGALYTAYRTQIHLNFNQPAAAETTVFSTYGSSTSYIDIRKFTHTVTTVYDGFTIYPGSGTITGTIRVYGYRNS